MDNISIKEIIKNNNSFLDNINQNLHNAGILFDERINIIIYLLNQKILNLSINATSVQLKKYKIDKLIITNIKGILEKLSLSKEELFQKVFMYYGSKYLKKELDQFYTPLTIGNFCCNLCIQNKNIIDPAAGTGDLAIYYKGAIDLWDVSNEVTEMAKMNYKFQNIQSTIETIDSLKNHDKNNNSYEYCLLNPPFGSKTITTDETILTHYELGRGKKKQELGILFIERSMNLLKAGGILYAIVPSGYLGNSNKPFVELRKYLLQHRMLAILRLPQNCFSRSGTGVSTYLLIIEKTKTKIDESYDILIEDVSEIGYDLHKKNTPHKYKKENNIYMLTENNEPIILNDFDTIDNKLQQFSYDNNITQLRSSNNLTGYYTMNTKELNDRYILDIGRYLKNYKDAIGKLEGEKSIKHYLINDYSNKFEINNEEQYTYIDIKEVNTPFYNGKEMNGSDLPSRAKHQLKKNDIIISKLKGNISFSLILEDIDNLICTNGFCVLRPKDEKSMVIIFGNLFSKDFKIQHNALTTGSIMESLSDGEIKNIVIDSKIDTEKYKKIINSLITLKEELKDLSN